MKPTPPIMPRGAAALVFEPDAFRIDGPKLMGRQAAGHNFLRAVVAGRLPNEVLWAYTRNTKTVNAFDAMARQLDPSVRTGWAPADRPELLDRIGALHRPDPNLAPLANLRLRSNPRAWSLTGVTHTTASHGAMGAMVDLLAAPVMPWDALICTSQAVRSTVQVLFEAQAEYFRWRLGARHFTLPQLPIIPLGVHCGDFVFSPEARRSARQALGIRDDEVAALFLGRLSFHAKMHPHVMYTGLEAAARQAGKSVALLHCGWFSNSNIETHMKECASRFAPSIRSLWSDGREAAARDQAWAAADLFVSLADNIQETFGLTPIEAMAAGLPVVISDWNGYKDTVRDGIDGFRIETWMPPSPLGDSYNLQYEAGTLDYDRYLGFLCQHVSMDRRQLVERLAALIADPALRYSMGASGRLRARTEFDWSVVYAQYRALWEHLADLRAHGPEVAAPPILGAVPQRMEPFRAFANYPSHTLGPRTLVQRLETTADWPSLRQHPLFNYAESILPSPELAEALLAPLQSQQPLALETLAQLAEVSVETAMLACSSLAKAGFIELGEG